jgi:peptidoglycan/LPS O-acetylase OafA/YrhL
MLDVARFVAALAVIWIHTPRSPELLASRELGRFAVPFFVATAVFFAWQSARRHCEVPARGYARTRLVRIYVPFLAWSAIYLVFKVAKAAIAPDLANDFPGWEFLWVGGFYHLWFMPFVMVVSMLAFALARAGVTRVGSAMAFGAVCALAGTLLAIVPAPTCLDEVGSWARLEWNALPAVAFGLALAALHGDRRSAIAEDFRVTALALLIAAACMFWNMVAPSSALAPNIAGACALIAALAWPTDLSMTSLQRLGGLSLGIYCSHLLLIKSIEAVAAKLHRPASWEIDLTTFILTAVVSTSLSFALSQSRFSRWLVA